MLEPEEGELDVLCDDDGSGACISVFVYQSRVGVCLHVCSSVIILLCLWYEAIGQAVVIGTNGTSFQPLDKYLKLGVFIDPMGKVYISQSHTEAEAAQPISLLAAQHFVCKVSAPFGSSSSAATVDFEVAVLSRPKLCNNNWLWLLSYI